MKIRFSVKSVLSSHRAGRVVRSHLVLVGNPHRVSLRVVNLFLKKINTENYSKTASKSLDCLFTVCLVTCLDDVLLDAVLGAGCRVVGCLRRGFYEVSARDGSVSLVVFHVCVDLSQLFDVAKMNVTNYIS